MLMSDFICRVCGNNTYNYHGGITINNQIISPPFYECTGCSITFGQPELFSLPTIKFKLIHKNAKHPFKAYDGDTGWDVYSIEKTIIPAGKAKLVGTGVCFDFPENIDCQIRQRSGLAKHLIIPNAPATIDNKYKGELKVRLFNYTDEDYTIEIGDRIAQFVFAPAHQYKLKETKDVGSSERGEGGFTSSGK